jgi:hypothetical protein
MTRWFASVLAILLPSFPGVANAQVDCNAAPAGSARTDCYIGLSRIYRGQSDVAAAKAGVQSDLARYRQVTGTSRSKRKLHSSQQAITIHKRMGRHRPP